MGPFVSNEGNKVLCIQPQGLYSQHFIYFLTYEMDQKASAFDNRKPLQPNVMHFLAYRTICKLRRKCSVVNTAHKCKLRMLKLKNTGPCKCFSMVSFCLVKY